MLYLWLKNLDGYERLDYISYYRGIDDTFVPADIGRFERMSVWYVLCGIPVHGIAN